MNSQGNLLPCEFILLKQSLELCSCQGQHVAHLLGRHRLNILMFRSTLGSSSQNAGCTMAAAAARLALQRFSWRRRVTPKPVMPRRPTFWPQWLQAARVQGFISFSSTTQIFWGVLGPTKNSSPIIKRQGLKASGPYKTAMQHVTCRGKNCQTLLVTLGFSHSQRTVKVIVTVVTIAKVFGPRPAESAATGSSSFLAVGFYASEQRTSVPYIVGWKSRATST